MLPQPPVPSWPWLSQWGLKQAESQPTAVIPEAEGGILSPVVIWPTTLGLHWLGPPSPLASPEVSVTSFISCFLAGCGPKSLKKPVFSVSLSLLSCDRGVLGNGKMA